MPQPPIPTSSHPAVAEFKALMEQRKDGHELHPMEIWECYQALMEAGWVGLASRLAQYLPD